MKNMYRSMYAVLEFVKIIFIVIVIVIVNGGSRSFCCSRSNGSGSVRNIRNRIQVVQQ